MQADHITPHSRGGPTKLSNGQILCDPHNKKKRDT
ncbi:MAG: HNH endonuclease [Acidimicrobiia bacterium]|nr:HNH endonuclease [Acidimicrobiia bacterium]